LEIWPSKSPRDLSKIASRSPRSSPLAAPEPAEDPELPVSAALPFAPADPADCWPAWPPDCPELPDAPSPGDEPDSLVLGEPPPGDEPDSLLLLGEPPADDEPDPLLLLGEPLPDDEPDPLLLLLGEPDDWLPVVLQAVTAIAAIKATIILAWRVIDDPC
jgi:hypothetical protein